MPKTKWKKRPGFSMPVNELMKTHRIALAWGRDLPIKWKHAVEICNAIMEKRMTLKEAQEFLENVIELKEWVPFYRFKGDVAHRPGEGRQWKIKSGRYPVKAAKYILRVLKDAEANARAKNMNPENCRILLIAAHKGRIIRRRVDRIGPGLFRGWKIKRATNIEVVVVEVPEKIEEEKEEVEIAEEIEKPAEAKEKELKELEAEIEKMEVEEEAKEEAEEEIETEKELEELEAELRKAEQETTESESKSLNEG